MNDFCYIFMHKENMLIKVRRDGLIGVQWND